MSDPESNLIPAKPLMWYYRQALEAELSLAGRQRLLGMLSEELVLMHAQFFHELLTPSSEWEIPNWAPDTALEALQVGYNTCERIEALKTDLREQTMKRDGREEWPWRRYKPEQIFDDREGPAQQQMILPGMEQQLGFEEFPKLPVWGIITGKRA